jgi:hypothetical protein
VISGRMTDRRSIATGTVGLASPTLLWCPGLDDWSLVARARSSRRCSRCSHGVSAIDTSRGQLGVDLGYLSEGFLVRENLGRSRVERPVCARGDGRRVSG